MVPAVIPDKYLHCWKTQQPGPSIPVKLGGARKDVGAAASAVRRPELDDACGRRLRPLKSAQSLKSKEKGRLDSSLPESSKEQPD
jgi:hypothetical protein